MLYNEFITCKCSINETLLIAQKLLNFDEKIDLGNSVIMKLNW